MLHFANAILYQIKLHENSFFFLVCLLLLLAENVFAQGTKATTFTNATAATHNSSSRSITSLEYSLDAVLWQQHSGEYKALCYQTFALAKLRLMEKITAHKKDEAPLAIITDIDETVLDNSPQRADDIVHHTT